jgi:hypothetical protein
VAIVTRGDAFIALWQAPALMHLIRWQFDIADRHAESCPEGQVALIILLPSSSPPDAVTTVECMRRLRKLRHAIRRQSAVAIGGPLWQTVVRNVHRAMEWRMLPRAGRVTLSGTIEDGIHRLLERKSVFTPSYPEMRQEVLTLFERLDIDPPDIPY